MGPLTDDWVRRWRPPTCAVSPFCRPLVAPRTYRVTCAWRVRMRSKRVWPSHASDVTELLNHGLSSPQESVLCLFPVWCILTKKCFLHAYPRASYNNSALTHLSTYLFTKVYINIQELSYATSWLLFFLSPTRIDINIRHDLHLLLIICVLILFYLLSS